jgi:DNA-directed RNA polymerase subunit beta'
VSEALLALDRGHSLHDPIRIRLEGKTLPAEMLPEGYDPPTRSGRVARRSSDHDRPRDAQRRVPDDFEFRNQPVLKGDVARLVDEVVHRYDRAQVEQVLDDLKNLGFHYATRAGVTIGIEDVTTPPTKAASWTITRSGPRRSSSSTAAASSPTMSAARS